MLALFVVYRGKITTKICIMQIFTGEMVGGMGILGTMGILGAMGILGMLGILGGLGMVGGMGGDGSHLGEEQMGENLAVVVKNVTFAG